MSDPNVWIRAKMRPDGYEYYEMLHFNVDDIMVVSHLGDKVARKIGNLCQINEGSQGQNTRYLGADM